MRCGIKRVIGWKNCRLRSAQWKIRFPEAWIIERKLTSARLAGYKLTEAAKLVAARMRRTKQAVRSWLARRAAGDVMTQLFGDWRVIETDRLVAADAGDRRDDALIGRSGRGGWMSTSGSARSASKRKFSSPRREEAEPLDHTLIFGPPGLGDHAATSLLRKWACS